MIICGTGHRPDKLGGYGMHTAERAHALAHAWLEQHQPARVISGMAQGWDMALAEAAVGLAIPFVAAVPFPGFESRWPLGTREHFRYLLKNAQEVEYVDDVFSIAALHARNQWMVDHADGVLALWNGTSGGTANCIRYAEKVGRPVLNLWEYYR